MVPALKTTTAPRSLGIIIGKIQLSILDKHSVNEMQLIFDPKSNSIFKTSCLFSFEKLSQMFKSVYYTPKQSLNWVIYVGLRREEIFSESVTKNWSYENWYKYRKFWWRNSNSLVKQKTCETKRSLLKVKKLEKEENWWWYGENKYHCVPSKNKLYPHLIWKANSRFLKTRIGFTKLRLGFAIILRDENFITSLAMVNLHPKICIHWVVFTEGTYFDSHHCPLSSDTLNHKKSRHGSYVESENQIQKHGSFFQVTV